MLEVYLENNSALRCYSDFLVTQEDSYYNYIYMMSLVGRESIVKAFTAAFINNKEIVVAKGEEITLYSKAISKFSIVRQKVKTEKGNFVRSLIYAKTLLDNKSLILFRGKEKEKIMSIVSEISTVPIPKESSEYLWENYIKGNFEKLNVYGADFKAIRLDSFAFDNSSIMEMVKTAMIH